VPLRLTQPSTAFISPKMAFKRDVFPAPTGPTIAVNCPGGMSISTFISANLLSSASLAAGSAAGSAAASAAFPALSSGGFFSLPPVFTASFLFPLLNTLLKIPRFAPFSCCSARREGSGGGGSPHSKEPFSTLISPTSQEASLLLIVAVFSNPKKRSIRFTDTFASTTAVTANGRLKRGPRSPLRSRIAVNTLETSNSFLNTPV